MTGEAEKKSFDVMKWLRETRDRHYEETKDMTPEERLRWLKKRPTDPVLAEFFDRIKAPETVRTAVRGSGTSETQRDDEHDPGSVG